MSEMVKAPTAGGVVEGGLMALVTGPTFQSMIRQALPKVGLTPERLTRVIATEFRGQPLLNVCTPQSFYRAVITCAELALMPGPALGLCYILPFKNSNLKGPYTHEATFVLGYPGAAALAWRSDMIERITSRVVWQGDEFRVRYGTSEEIHHIPNEDEETRGNVRGYYATLGVKGASSPMFVYKTLPQIISFRAQYVRNKSGPWWGNPGGNEFDWMAMKTTFKQVAKLGPRAESLFQAIAADDRSELGLAPEIDVTDEANLLTQMAEEAKEVAASGGFGAQPVSGGGGPDDADLSQEPAPKLAAAKDGEALCDSPIDGGCVRAKWHRRECLNAAGVTEKFE